MQTRLTRIETVIVNVEMVADDGGHIPAQYQDLSYPGEILELCGRMQERYANSRTAPIMHAKGIRDEERLWLEECRKNVRRNARVPGREDHTNCVDLRNLRKTE
jgi:hypothetical protein